MLSKLLCCSIVLDSHFLRTSWFTVNTLLILHISRWYESDYPLHEHEEVKYCMFGNSISYYLNFWQVSSLLVLCLSDFCSCCIPSVASICLHHRDNYDSGWRAGLAQEWLGSAKWVNMYILTHTTPLLCIPQQLMTKCRQKCQHHFHTNQSQSYNNLHIIMTIICVNLFINKMIINCSVKSFKERI